MRRRHAYVAGAAVAVLVLAALTLRWAPALTMAATLAVPSVGSWLGPLVPDVAQSEITIDVDGRSLRADVYRATPAPPAGIVLVHGLSRAGGRHPELVHLAQRLAERGRLVVVPELRGLAAFTLGGNEITEIRAVIAHLARSTSSVGVAGFSFGAGPALIAAADVPAVDLAGSFGGYAHLRHVIAYVTTGVHAYGGRRHVAHQQEYNRWKLLALLAGFADDERDRHILAIVAERKLADPGTDISAVERNLTAGGHAIVALVTNRDERALAARLDALPASARRAIDTLSPISVVPRIGGRLVIAHGMGDDSIPFTESLRLADAAGGRARVALLRTFHHTGAQSAWRSLLDHARDGASLVGLADELLRNGPR